MKFGRKTLRKFRMKFIEVFKVRHQCLYVLLKACIACLICLVCLLFSVSFQEANGSDFLR